jgi:hypothetical protein
MLLPPAVRPDVQTRPARVSCLSVSRDDVNAFEMTCVKLVQSAEDVTQADS